MRNQRDGTFRDVTAESGLDKNNTRYSFCCGWSDYNRDGWPDLYVVNDFGRKNLYRNNGDGTFTDVAPQAGVEDVGAGMSVCWLDYDNDGAEDLYVANMWTAAGKRISTQEIFQKDAPEDSSRPLSQTCHGQFAVSQSNGDGAFQDQGASAGVEMGRWSWSSDAWDFDHDGFPDLYITNGMVSGESREDLTVSSGGRWWPIARWKPSPRTITSRDGTRSTNSFAPTAPGAGTSATFSTRTIGMALFPTSPAPSGLDFLEDGRSFALADFDHDGRLEVFLKNRNGPQLRLLKNVDEGSSAVDRLPSPRQKSNRDAIGAAVTLETESGRQTRMLQAGSGFLSQHSKEVFFGLGDAKGPVRASIRWPSGLVQQINNLPLNHRVWVEEGSETPRIEAFKASPQGVKPVPARLVGAAEAAPLLSIPNKVETWLLAPVSAPDFSLPDLAGQAHALTTLRGKPLLLNFWTRSSTACDEDLNTSTRLQKRWAGRGPQMLSVNVDDPADAEKFRAQMQQRRLSFPVLLASDDVAGIYNILYRYLFDRHRDLSLPTSFLIDDGGNIVKVYQGPVNPEHIEQDFSHLPQSEVERLAKALPFPGVSDGLVFRRNYLNYGSVYFQRGYYDQAEVWFRLALRDDPASSEALYGLGSVYLKQEKSAEARESFEHATRLPGQLSRHAGELVE